MGGDSSSSNKTQTTNNDRRIANDTGTVLQGDGSFFNLPTNITTNTLDGGAIDRAFQSVDATNSNVKDTYDKLLSTATHVFDSGQALIGQTQASVTDAYNLAQTTAKGTIDNKTIVIIVLAVGAVGVAYVASKR